VILELNGECILRTWYGGRITGSHCTVVIGLFNDAVSAGHVT